MKVILWDLTGQAENWLAQEAKWERIEIVYKLGTDLSYASTILNNVPYECILAFMSDQNSAEIKNCGGKLLKLYEVILTRTAPQNFESEVLSAAVQIALSFVLAEKFDQQQLDKLCNYYNYSRQAGRTVIAPLEMFLQNAMIKFAEMSYNAGNKIDSANRLEFAEKLNLPHNQNFYLM